MKKTLFALVTCVCLGSGPATAQHEPLQVSYDGGSLAVTPAGRTARLAFPGGDELVLDLPEKAELSSLAAVDGGWALAGSALAADGRRRLFLLAGDREVARSLPVPGEQQGQARLGAVLLTEAGRLAGAAWLEGDGSQSLSVRASRWRDGGWAPPETVASPGPGSQLALSGVVLADGSWLLAWSAFDGQDDEIVWSWKVGESWSPVERLAAADNAVPDITPALAPSGTGAVAAWSRYDGNDYRLVLARFAGGEWRDERVAGGAGSLYPRFLAGGDAPRLLHLSARPAGWTVLDLDGRGRVVRRAEVASEHLERPLVLSGEGGGVRLLWPGDESERSAPLREVSP